jgi:hypothetical protein
MVRDFRLSEQCRGRSISSWMLSRGTYLPTIRVRVQASYLVQDSPSTEKEVLIGPEDGGNKLLREIGTYLPRYMALQPTKFGSAFVRQLRERRLCDREVVLRL